jgi:hypothetical protein
MKPALHETLKRLRSRLPRLAEVLGLDVGAELAAWCQVVDTRLLARFDPGFPLVAAICGGGSSGKSTLFNTLLGERCSPTGGRAGMNRRVLISVPEGFEAKAAFVSNLVAPFSEAPVALRSPEELLVPGPPATRVHRGRAENLILIDTPDFDTGAGGRYANRESARGALEAADLLIYVFTNSNYNNRDNTDFIASMLTGIGRRRCFLVYRAYPSFTAEEVRAHAMTVARHIYGADAGRFVLGVFRADEDNRVAAGESPMTLRPVEAAGGSFAGALEAIDVRSLREELHASMTADVLKGAAELTGRAEQSLRELERYGCALAALQEAGLQEVLRFFPAERVLRRFAGIWAESDPPAVKFMRRTGSLIEFPLKAVLGAAGWARERMGALPAPPDPVKSFEARLEENLIAAVTELHRQLLSPYVPAPRPAPAPAGEAPGAPPMIGAHPAVQTARESLRRREVGGILRAVLAHQEEIGSIGRDVDAELRELAERFRSQMGLWEKISQTFWAFLNVLPATLAVTYVITTGDPVGAASIKVKLAGLFGLKDLYALVAIPVTRGMKQADRNQLKEMLGPLAQTWLRHKFGAVREVFERELSGEVLRAVAAAEDEARRLIGALSPPAPGRTP